MRVTLTKYDYGRTYQYEDYAEQICAAWPDSVHRPEPCERCCDIHATIRGKRASGGRRVHTCEQRRKDHKADDSRNGPESRLAEPQPRPEGEAAADFGKRGCEIQHCGIQDGITTRLWRRAVAPELLARTA